MRACGSIISLHLYLWVGSLNAFVGAVLNRAIVVERCCIEKSSKTPRFDFATLTIKSFSGLRSRPCPCSLVCCGVFLSCNLSVFCYCNLTEQVIEFSITSSL